MMNNLAYIIIGMFVVDLIFTYINVNKYRKLLPKKDFTNIELNPIVKGMWRNFGLLYGGIIATIIQILILFFVINYLGYTFLLIFLGIYITIILIHIDNFNLIREKRRKKPKKKVKKWRKYIIIIILLMGFIDLCLTFYYISNYSAWQPNRPFSNMENNPLLLFLWNKLGLVTGMITGFLIIIPLQYLISKKAHFLIVLMLFIALSFAMINHYNNINLLHDLIKIYPTGYR